jgi:hypothetical protein
MLVGVLVSTRSISFCICCICTNTDLYFAVVLFNSVLKVICTALVRLDTKVKQIFLLFFHDLLFTGILIERTHVIMWLKNLIHTTFTLYRSLISLSVSLIQNMNQYIIL